MDIVKSWLQLDWCFPKATATKSKQLWKIFAEWRLVSEGILYHQAQAPQRELFFMIF
jgi:hypothetical protein